MSVPHPQTAVCEACNDGIHLWQAPGGDWYWAHDDMVRWPHIPKPAPMLPLDEDEPAP